MKVLLIINDEENYTGYCDKEGNKLYLNDTIEIYDTLGAIYRSKIIYEDGIITISYLSSDLTQIKNPPNWKEKHDWVKSKWCGIHIGYPEHGTWNHPRRTLQDICGTFKSYDEFVEVYKKHKYKYNIEFVFTNLFRPLPCLKIN